MAFAMSAFDDFDDDEPRQTLRRKRAGIQGLGSGRGLRTGEQDVAADGRGGRGRGTPDANARGSGAREPEECDNASDQVGKLGDSNLAFRVLVTLCIEPCG